MSNQRNENAHKMKRRFLFYEREGAHRKMYSNVYVYVFYLIKFYVTYRSLFSLVVSDQFRKKKK